jgi:hypothetical protein
MLTPRQEEGCVGGRHRISVWGIIVLFVGERNGRNNIPVPSVVAAIGALIGGLLVGTIPAAMLKIGLGIILIISAIRTFQHMRAA